MNEYITQKETAQYLGISTASVHNWIRHGYLKKHGNQYKFSQIADVKRKIDSGEISRLNNRANKSKSVNTFIPHEYISSPVYLKEIERIVGFINEHRIKPVQAIFILALNLFRQNDDIAYSSADELFSFSKENFRRNEVHKFLKTWKEGLSSKKINYNNEKVQFLLNCHLPQERDILGIMYQSVIHEGEKSCLGSYYTPGEVVHNLLDGRIHENCKVLDPCCGTGQFLLYFSETILNPVNIYGCDIDENAVNIARCNLFLQYKNHNFSPNIYHINTLLMKHENSLFGEEQSDMGNFDVIATNPPWGARYNNDSEIKKLFPEIASKESFSFFIIQSVRLLHEKGEMYFVLPESITNVRAHKDIREYILKNCAVDNIGILGKRFKNVMSPVITLSLRKEKVSDYKITVVHGTVSYEINQERFTQNKHSLFSIYIQETDADIFSKMEKTAYITLEGNADWVLGIVTGNNKKFLKNTPADNCEPIYTGADIFPFKCKEPENYIEFSPSLFQQAAPTEKYRVSEKLVYKFISKNLVCAYDNTRSLTLNSANILIPAIPNYPMKLILGFLNSKLFKFYFRKKFSSVKVLRGDIEQLPFPVLSGNDRELLLNVVNDILDSKCSTDVLNTFIFRLYGLSDDEISHVNSYVTG
ncbi:MAG: N-6 DNA methylase [Salinispira sp.]